MTHELKPSHTKTENGKNAVIAHTHYNFFSQLHQFSTVLHVHVYMDNNFTNDFLGKILAVLVVVWLVRHNHYSIKLNTSRNHAKDKNTCNFCW